MIAARTADQSADTERDDLWQRLDPFLYDTDRARLCLCDRLLLLIKDGQYHNLDGLVQAVPAEHGAAHS